jgi:hypothetical protein
MVALGFLDAGHGSYSNGAAAGTFLAGRTPADLRPVLRFRDLVSYPAWMQLEPVLRGRCAPGSSAQSWRMSSRPGSRH